MDYKDIQAHKEVLIKEMETEVKELERVANEAEALAGTYFKDLPKVHIYNKRKADLQRLLRDYGYQGKTMESMIHRPDRDDSYINEEGRQVWMRHQCQYLLYSEDEELNEELQVTLTLDETESQTAFIMRKEPYKSYYGSVNSMTQEQVDKMAFSQRLEALRDFKYQCQRKINDINYRIRSVRQVGTKDTTADDVRNSLEMLRAAKK